MNERIELQTYITPEILDALDKLCLEFTEGNRAQFVKQCLEIGIREFEMLSRSKKIMNNAQDACEVEL